MLLVVIDGQYPVRLHTTHGLRLGDGRVFSTNVYAKNRTFYYHKTVCGALNPAYCKCAVMRSPLCPVATHFQFIYSK